MTDIHSAQNVDLPGSELEIAKMPGHWLLARLGKRVLRPGGLKLTRTLLDELAIGPSDEVVEFAPGLGVTARMILQRRPQRYTDARRADKLSRLRGWRRAPTVLRLLLRTHRACCTLSVNCYASANSLKNTESRSRYLKDHYSRRWLMANSLCARPATSTS